MNAKRVLAKAGQWILLAGAVAGFAWKLLPPGLPPGNEATVFEALDRVILRSWALYGRFPLWNPYLRSGMPLIGDPMLHFGNPLVAVPIALLDVGLGFRVALVLSFLAAALGMWSLAAALQVRGPVRIWMSILYAFSGPAVARFYQGQYLFVFGFAWIPWVLAAFLRLSRTRRPRDAACAAVALALLFLSGNVYYTFFVVPALFFLFAALGGFRVHRRFPFLALDGKLTVLFASASLLFLLLVSVQLLPMFQVRPRMIKAVNVEMTDSQTIPQIVRDLVSEDTGRPDAIRTLTTEEFYAYIGFAPLALLLLVPLALRGERRRATGAFLALLVYAVAWIDIAQMPWRSVYRSSGWLHQFRYPTRMLAFVVVAVLVLAGLGADSAWRLLRQARESSATGPGPAAVAALGLVAALLVFSCVQVFRINRRIVAVAPEPPRWTVPLDWVRAHDSGEFLMAADGEYQPVIARGLHDLWSWYHWDFHKPERDPRFRRAVVPRPEYLVRSIQDGPPKFDEPALGDAIPVVRTGQHAVYRLPHALPYAFAAAREVVEESSPRGEVFREEVVPLRPIYRNSDTIEVATDAARAGWLVLMVAHYPGWTVSVDGKPAALRDADGYLAADLLPGRRLYVFAFRPLPFRVGVLLSLAGVFATAWILVRDGA